MDRLRRPTTHTAIAPPGYDVPIDAASFAVDRRLMRRSERTFMSDTLVIPRIITANPALAETRPIGSASTWMPLGIWLIGLSALFLSWRIYQHLYAWSTGLDATSPEYAMWMNAFYANTVFISVGTLIFFYFAT